MVRRPRGQRRGAGGDAAAGARLVGERCGDAFGIELSPGRWQGHYDFGLFLKTRGRFKEGVELNQRAWELGGADDESARWNLGICATAVGDTDTALQAWRALGLSIERGMFGLPEGKYGMVKVRLAQRPLAERGGEGMPDDPGLEETIWIKRLSPCHGVILSVLVQDLGVDYGDVILFDGAPITHHMYGESRVPVFAHLKTLLRRHYRRYPFAGTQAQQQITQLELEHDAVAYVHTEQVVQMCKACWESATVDHASHASSEQRVVTGKVCAPPDMEPAVLQGMLDQALAKTEGARLYVPELAVQWATRSAPMWSGGATRCWWAVSRAGDVAPGAAR